MKTNLRRIFIVFLALTIMCYTCVLSGCFITNLGSSRYEYVNSQGESSFFEVNFSNNTYTYEGNGFYSESFGYMLKPGTKYKVSGRIIYIKTVNDKYYYNFLHHPWDDKCYAVFSSDKTELRYSGLSGYPYSFKKVK